MSKAALHLIPVPISTGNIQSLSISAIEAAKSLQHFVAERAKSARAFLKLIEHPIPINLIEIYEIPPKDESLFYQEMIQQLKQGLSLGLVSEVGLPCVADPGYQLVELAHQAHISVFPYPGPNSILLALMASGFNGQEFHFHGYLPAKKAELRHKLIWLNNEMHKSNATHIFMETPYRSKQILEMVLTHIPADINLCIASNLTGPYQYIESRCIKKWNPESLIKFYDTTCIYLLSK